MWAAVDALAIARAIDGDEIERQQWLELRDKFSGKQPAAPKKAKKRPTWEEKSWYSEH